MKGIFLKISLNINSENVNLLNNTNFIVIQSLFIFFIIFVTKHKQTFFHQYEPEAFKLLLIYFHQGGLIILVIIFCHLKSREIREKPFMTKFQINFEFTRKPILSYDTQREFQSK